MNHVPEISFEFKNYHDAIRLNSTKKLNKAISALNSLIDLYHQSSKFCDQKKWLIEIYKAYQQFDHHFLLEILEGWQSYHQTIHHDLYNDICHEVASLGLSIGDLFTKQSSSLIDEVGASSASSPSSLQTVLAMMPPKKLDKLAKNLSYPRRSPDAYSGQARVNYLREKNQWLTTAQARLYDLFREYEAGYEAWQLFLSEHSIRYIGGKNSINYEVRNINTGKAEVLKISNQLGGKPTNLNPLLSSEKCSPSIAAERCVRFASFKNKKYGIDRESKVCKRMVLVTEYIEDGTYNPKEVAALSQIKNDSFLKEINFEIAVCEIMTRLVSFLKPISQEGFGTTDLKPSNLFLEKDKTVFPECLKVKMADTKSFMQFKGGFFFPGNRRKKICKQSSVVHTYGYMAPECQGEPSVSEPKKYLKSDKMHVYAMGKMLKQFVKDFYGNQTHYLFCHLINLSIAEHARDRITLKQFKEQLNHIKLQLLEKMKFLSLWRQKNTFALRFRNQQVKRLQAGVDYPEAVRICSLITLQARSNFVLEDERESDYKQCARALFSVAMRSLSQKKSFEGSDVQGIFQSYRSVVDILEWELNCSSRIRSHLKAHYDFERLFIGPLSHFHQETNTRVLDAFKTLKVRLEFNQEVLELAETLIKRLQSKNLMLPDEGQLFLEKFSDYLLKYEARSEVMHGSKNRVLIVLEALNQCNYFEAEPDLPRRSVKAAHDILNTMVSDINTFFSCSADSLWVGYQQLKLFIKTQKIVYLKGCPEAQKEEYQALSMSLSQGGVIAVDRLYQEYRAIRQSHLLASQNRLHKNTLELLKSLERINPDIASDFKQAFSKYIEDPFSNFDEEVDFVLDKIGRLVVCLEEERNGFETVINDLELKIQETIGCFKEKCLTEDIKVHIKSHVAFYEKRMHALETLGFINSQIVGDVLLGDIFFKLYEAKNSDELQKGLTIAKGFYKHLWKAEPFKNAQIMFLKQIESGRDEMCIQKAGDRNKKLFEIDGVLPLLYRRFESSDLEDTHGKPVDLSEKKALIDMFIALYQRSQTPAHPPRTVYDQFSKALGEKIREKLIKCLLQTDCFSDAQKNVMLFIKKFKVLHQICATETRTNSLFLSHKMIPWLLRCETKRDILDLTNVLYLYEHSVQKGLNQNFKKSLFDNCLKTAEQSDQFEMNPQKAGCAHESAGTSGMRLR